MTGTATLYCIADDHSFRLMRGQGDRLQEVNAARADDFADVPHKLQKPGRNRAGGVSFGHETGSSTAIERPRFARHIVAALKDEWHKGGAGRIVLVAAPKMLGALRKAMPKDLAREITAEVDKDLSDIPVHDLARHLGSLA